MSTPDVLQAGGHQRLPQELGIRHLERQRWGIQRKPREAGNGLLHRRHEEPEELDLGGRAVDHQEHAAAGPGHPLHLAERARQVGEEHDAVWEPAVSKLSSRQLERVAIHDSRLDVEALRAGRARRAADHRRRDIGRHTRAPRRAAGNAQRATARRDVQEALAACDTGSAARACASEPRVGVGVTYSS